VKLAALVLGCIIAAATTARAETITVGLFAPTAPFPSTAARVELASRLGDHVGKVFGMTGNGKVFARASDFSAAVKKGEVTVALVDATFLAATGGNYTVIAAGVRGGESAHGWQLVARSADKIAALKGKRILVPSVGGREADFVLNVLLGGEVGKDFFAKIEAAPDTASALAALGLGKTDAAIVPASVDLPSGTTSILSLPALSGPVLVVFGTVSAQRKTSLVEAAGTFKGDATVATLRAADADAVRQIVRRFSPPVKRGPLAVPAIRLLVGDLVEGRTFTIERTPVTSFAASPDRH
jgi:ethanolamine utilization microcompartment shell protein EutS